MNNQRQTKQRFRCKMISWITLIFYIFQPIVGVLANPQTNIAPNGVEIVDINAPNQSGVSHNQYDRFNVKEKGLIFNNSGEIINTTLAGYILGNPNIEANSASLILNEVIGTQPSYLNGYMEIAGNKAQLIIANPNGIIGNGFGFINTSRAVLTTGTPIFGDQGTLAGFNVNDGTIAIEGQGLNANEIDRVDILAKAVEVNAGIWANQLNVVTGKNTVDNDLNMQTSDLDEPIGVALDVSALGGMYANKIRLIGTQNGVGVNSKGAIIATDSLTLNQQGKILFAGTTLADQAIKIQAQGELENQGQLHANGNLDIQAVSVNNGNLMTANQDVNLTASLVNSKGFLGAGIDEDGIFNENGNLHIDADTISLKNAKTCAGNDIALQATQTVENQGQIYANGKLAIQAPSIHNENLMAANQDTNLTASLVTSTGFLGAGISEEGIFNQNGNLQVTADNILLSNANTRAGNDIILQATQAIENENSKILANGTILLTAKDRVNNTQNGQIVGNQSVEIQAGAVNSTGLIGVGIDEAGTLSKDGTLSIAADTISFHHAKTYAGETIELQAKESIENTESTILSNGDALLTANGMVSNKNGQLLSQKSVQIQAGVVDSSGLIGVGIDETGQLSKSGTLHIAADTISFDHANTYAGESIKLQAKESIENTDSSLLSNGDALLTANQMVSNQNGKLMSKESMEIQAGAMTSSGLIGVGIDETGELSKDGTLHITADTISFDHAKTYAGESIKLQAKENIENKASTLLSNGDALLTGNRMVSNENSKLLSKKSMEIQAGAVESTGLIGVGVNEDGILSEAGNLQITADTIAFNRAKTYAGKNVTLQANSSIVNDNSTLLANNAMTVTSQGSVTNRQNSQISSGKSLVIQATQGIENNQSRLSSAEKMSLHTNGSFTNTNGRIEAVDDIELKANQDIENINSTILANGTIQLTANQHFNNSQNAQITSGKSLAIEGKNGVVNSQSGLTSCGDLAIETNETFTNVKGKIEAVDELQLQAGKNIENTNSTLLANGKMDLNSKGSLKNTQNSRIASGNTLSIQAQDGIENSQSSLASAGNITVDTMGILSNTKGNIEAQKELIVAVNAVENDAESKIIGVDGQLAIHAQQKIENHGMIGSNQAVNLTGTEIINQAGTITSQDALHIEAQNSVDNTNGSIQTKKIATIQAQTLLNHQGHMDAGEGIELNLKTIQGNGSIQAEDFVILNTEGDYIAEEQSQIKSNGSLDIITTGNVVNQHTLAAVTRLGIQGNQISNTGTLTANAQVELKGNYINNQGRIDSQEIELTAPTIDNQNTIIGGNLTVHSNDFNNSGSAAILATTQDTNLYVQNTLNNQDHATIYSLGNLQIAANENGGKANRILNQSATIEAGENMALCASDITNKRTEFTMSEVETIEYEETKPEIPERPWEIGGKEEKPKKPKVKEETVSMTYGIDSSTRVYREYTESEKRTIIEKDSGVATIQAGKDMQIQADTLTNDVSRILANQNLTITSNQVNNIAANHQITTIKDGDLMEYYRIYYSSESGGDGGGSNGHTEETTKKLGDYHEEIVEIIPGYDSIISGNESVQIATKNLNNSATTRTENIGANVTVLKDNSLGKLVKNNGDVVKDGKSKTNVGLIENNIGTNSAAIEATETNVGNVSTYIRKVNTNVGKVTTKVGNVDANHIFILPNQGLYHIRREPTSRYLVETDVRFTNYKNFISSDYLLGKLNYSPDKVQKRLGDGFYEQQLVKNQIIEKMGKALLNGYTDGEEQFKQLLENGAKTSQSLQLSLGISLTAEQINALTEDIIWLEEKEVEGETVLAPVVYFGNAKNATLTNQGAIIAGGNVKIDATENLVNQGTITGDHNVDITGKNILNQSGIIKAQNQLTLVAKENILNQNATIIGKDVFLEAGQDIKNEFISSQIFSQNQNEPILINQASSIEAMGDLKIDVQRDFINTGSKISGKDIAIDAGRNIEIGTTLSEEKTDSWDIFHKIHEGKINTTSQINASGNLAINAQKDIDIKGCSLTAKEDISLSSGNNLNITSAVDTTYDKESLDFGYLKIKETETTQDKNVLSQLSAGANVTLSSQADTTLKGAQVTAEGKIVIAAKGEITIKADGNDSKIKITSSDIISEAGQIQVETTKDITIDAATEQHKREFISHKKKSGAFSSTTTDIYDYQNVDAVVGSNLSGDTITIKAGNDLTIAAGTIVATNDVDLQAKNDLTITSETEASQSEYEKQVKKSGIFGSGLGITIGKQKQKDTYENQNAEEIGSIIGSIKGNVTLESGKDVDIKASEVIAGKDINITGENVTIENADNTYDAKEKHEFKQSGLSVSLGGKSIDAAQSVIAPLERAGQVEDDRLKALYQYKAAETIKENKETLTDLANGKTDIGLSVSLGTSKAESSYQSDTTLNQGSSLYATGDVNIKATEKDITIKGSDITGENVNLDAKENINIIAGTNKNVGNGENSSSSASIGVSIGIGGITGINAGYNKANGGVKENAETHVASTITAKDTLTTKSGQDTNIIGSKLEGETINMEVGKDLNIESLQDKETYDEKNNGSTSKCTLDS